MVWHCARFNSWLFGGLGRCAKLQIRHIDASNQSPWTIFKKKCKRSLGSFGQKQAFRRQAPGPQSLVFCYGCEPTATLELAWLDAWPWHYVKGIFAGLKMMWWWMHLICLRGNLIGWRSNDRQGRIDLFPSRFHPMGGTNSCNTYDTNTKMFIETSMDNWLVL